MAPVVTKETLQAEYSAYSHLLDSLLEYTELAAKTADTPLDTEEGKKAYGARISELFGGMLADLDFLEFQGLLNQAAYDKRQREICLILGTPTPTPEEAGMPKPTVEGNNTLN